MAEILSPKLLLFVKLNKCEKCRHVLMYESHLRPRLKIKHFSVRLREQKMCWYFIWAECFIAFFWSGFNWKVHRFSFLSCKHIQFKYHLMVATLSRNGLSTVCTGPNNADCRRYTRMRTRVTNWRFLSTLNAYDFCIKMLFIIILTLCRRFHHSFPLLTLLKSQ